MILHTKIHGKTHNVTLTQFAAALLKSTPEALEQGAGVDRAVVARQWWMNLRLRDMEPSEILEQLRGGAAHPAADAGTVAGEVVEAFELPPEEAGPLTRYLGHTLARWQRQLELARFLGYPVPSPDADHKLVPYVLVRVPRFPTGYCPQGVGSLRLDRYLGGGGVGEVYLASSARFRHWRPFVLKCVPPEDKRFLEHEAYVLNDLAGRGCADGIIHAVDIYPEAEVPALKFPWLAGYTLQEILDFLYRNGTPPSPGLVIAVLTRFAGILGGIHRCLYVHRDIKPGNILFRKLPSGKWQIYLFDFGIAGPAERLCPDEWDVGPYTKVVIDRMLANSCSPIYASLQQRHGNYRCRACDDIYSTGVLAIQALTGNFRLWVEQYAWQDILRRRDTPEWFIALLECCVHAEQNRRPADGDQLHDCLVNRRIPR